MLCAMERIMKALLCCAFAVIGLFLASCTSDASAKNAALINQTQESQAHLAWPG